METVTTETNKIAPVPEFRKKIMHIQQSMLGVKGAVTGAELDEVFPLKHSFGEGVYVREIFLPKDSIIVGKIHKHEHPNFLMSGHVLVATEEGVKELKAPLSMISPAGTKRVVYAIENTVWVTVHVTDKTDLPAIEDEIIAKDFEELDEFINKGIIEIEQVKNEIDLPVEV